MTKNPMTPTFLAALALVLIPLPATAQVPSGGGMTEFQCLQAQNDWIEDCLDDWWGSLTGQLDNCIQDFDVAHPLCVGAGVSAAGAAHEVHDAYGAAGEIIGGAIGTVGGVGVALGHCAGGLFEGMYVLSEAGWILVSGDDYGDYGISDEEVEAAAEACWSTAANSLVLGGAIIAPELIAGAAIIDLGYQATLCWDACMNSPDSFACTQTCYEGLGTHASSLLGFLGLGYVAGEILPPEVLAPEIMGCRVRPGWADPATCSEPQGPECLDEFYTEFRCRIGDPTYQEGMVDDYGFSTAGNFQGQLEMLNAETAAGVGGEWVLEGSGLTPPQLLGTMESTPVNSHGLAAGYGHPTELNHGFYLGHGPGGISPVNSQGYIWPLYNLYIYHPGF